MDSATHRIIWWIGQLVFVILIHWIAIYPVYSAFQRLNNRGLFYCTDSAYSIDAISFILSVNFTSAWTYTHAQNGIIDCNRDTSSPQPDDKQVDVSSSILLLICLHEVWVKVTYDWPCSYACAYVDPVFTNQSYDISTSTSTR